MRAPTFLNLLDLGAATWWAYLVVWVFPRHGVWLVTDVVSLIAAFAYTHRAVKEWGGK